LSPWRKFDFISRDLIKYTIYWVDYLLWFFFVKMVYLTFSLSKYSQFIDLSTWREVLPFITKYFRMNLDASILRK
jgi:hypothetical protein